MIQVVIGSNYERNTVLVDSSSTLRAVLEDNGVDYSRSAVHLDGVSLKPGDLDKTFDDFGIAEKTYLTTTAKPDNA